MEAKMKGVCRNCGRKSGRVSCDDCRWSAEHAMRLISRSIEKFGKVACGEVGKPPPYFGRLRPNEWVPEFYWEETVGDAATAINKPHEDFPKRVKETKDMILVVKSRLLREMEVTNQLLLYIHGAIFPDLGNAAGAWRDVNVRVGMHVAPVYRNVPKLMLELQESYRGQEMTIDNLQHWYTDFNTIHPFQDGNGRTSGVVVAAASWLLKGKYLSPKQ